MDNIANHANFRAAHINKTPAARERNGRGKGEAGLNHFFRMEYRVEFLRRQIAEGHAGFLEGDVLLVGFLRRLGGVFVADDGV